MNICPICGSNGGKIECQVAFNNGKPDYPDEPISKTIPYLYIRCNSCNVIWCDTMIDWTPDQFGKMCYNEKYVRYDGDIENPHGNRPNFHVKLFQKTLQAFKSKRVLDYGCGKGFAVQRLRRDEFMDIHGYDPYYGNSTMPDGMFDAITMFEVLEHVYNPIEVLTNLKARLNTGGIIYASTDVTDRMKEVKSDYYTCPRVGHILLHSYQSLAYIAEKTGFNIVHMPLDYEHGMQCHIFIKR